MGQHGQKESTTLTRVKLRKKCLDALTPSITWRELTSRGTAAASKDRLKAFSHLLGQWICWEDKRERCQTYWSSIRMRLVGTEPFVSFNGDTVCLFSLCLSFFYWYRNLYDCQDTTFQESGWRARESIRSTWHQIWAGCINFCQHDRQWGQLVLWEQYALWNTQHFALQGVVTNTLPLF